MCVCVYVCVCTYVGTAVTDCCLPGTYLLHLARHTTEEGREAGNDVGPWDVEVCDDDEELGMHDHGLHGTNSMHARSWAARDRQHACTTMGFTGQTACMAR